MRLKRKDLVEYSQIGSNIAVVLTLLAALWIFWAEREATREIERQQLAAEMFMRKYDDRVHDAYTRVSQAFDNTNEVFPVFFGNQPDAKANLSRAILAKVPPAEIKVLVDYYDDLLICIDSGLCDRDVATKLIGRDLTYFYCKARFVGLPELKAAYASPDYGERLHAFVGKCPGDPGDAKINPAS